ncbi:MAG: endonuclease III [Deltaproteobacteria bacterium]|nr:endonuclease III [Deltaproteobacteria bacterium]
MLKSKSETLKERRQRVNDVILHLARLYPLATCGLIYSNPLELLVAVILSAQCTDIRVNQVTPALFALYPDTRAFAQASRSELEEAIRSTGFFRNKAKNIQLCCQLLLTRHACRIPSSLSELVKLPGIGRKTANVILGEIYGLQGVVVDTHVKRLSRLLSLTKSEYPVKIEQQLMKVVPENAWNLFSLLLIYHGRNLCPARRPGCEICPLVNLCPAGHEKVFS